jgi:predicted nucleic acid-binding protein
VISALICVDASLTLKLVLAEPDSPAARSLWADWEERDMAVVSPSLWAYEVTSVIRNKVHRGKITSHEGERAFAIIHKLGVRLIVPPDLHERAWEMAKELNRPAAYDAHYLALAQTLDCEFWTADGRLYNAVRDQLPWVRCLGLYDASLGDTSY